MIWHTADEEPEHDGDYLCWILFDCDGIAHPRFEANQWASYWRKYSIPGQIKYWAEIPPIPQE